MSFWLWAAVLVLLAAAFVAWPLLRKRAPVASAAQSNADTVRALYRERLEELDADVAVGQLAPEARDAVVAEMGAALLADHGQSGAAVRPAEGSRPRLALGVALLLILACILVYRQVGEPAAHRIAGAETVLRLDPSTQAGELDGWRARLEERVADKPEDAQSWYLLGHAQLLLQAYPQAAEAFAVAHSVVGDDPNIDVYWLQARYLAARGAIDATSQAIAERLLAARPNHPLVLEMYAIDAYRRGDYRGAVDFLNRALSGPLSPGQRATLARGLAQARADLGDLQPSIDLRVEAATQPPAGATLFVIARPVGGGMPYAVVRRPNANLPMSVRLDDAVAMNPGRALSAAEEIQVVVRLSLTGAPQAHPGDWEWRSEPLQVAELVQPFALQVELSPPAS